MHDLQLVVVSLIVAAAGGFLVRAGWRAWRGSPGGCGGGKCACPGQETEAPKLLISREKLVIRRPNRHGP